MPRHTETWLPRHQHYLHGENTHYTTVNWSLQFIQFTFCQDLDPTIGGHPERHHMICNTNYPYNMHPRRHSHEQHHQPLRTMPHLFNVYACNQITWYQFDSSPYSSLTNKNWKTTNHHYSPLKHTTKQPYTTNKLPRMNTTT